MPVQGVNAGTERIDRAHKHEHESLEARIAKLEAGQNTVKAIVPSPNKSGGGPSVVGIVGITGEGGIQVTTTDGQHITINIPPGTFAPSLGPGAGSSGPSFALREIKFFNAVADIPAGFYICDGSNGTPDLITNNPFLTMNGSAGAGAPFTDPAPLSLTVTVDPHVLTPGCADGANTDVAAVDGVNTGNVAHTVHSSGTVSGANIKAALHRFNLIPAMYLG